MECHSRQRPAAGCIKLFKTSLSLIFLCKTGLGCIVGVFKKVPDSCSSFEKSKKVYSNNKKGSNVYHILLPKTKLLYILNLINQILEVILIAYATVRKGVAPIFTPCFDLSPSPPFYALN